MKKLFKEN